MAPAYAMPTMLDRAGLSLQDFDFYEIHEAFAAQVLCTLQAWEDATFCRERLGRDEPLGAIDRDASSTSTAARSPPATRSPRPAGASSPASPSAARTRLGPRRDQHLRRRRPGRRRDRSKAPEVHAMSDRLLAGRQLAPGSARRQQVGLPQPVELDRHAPGAPVVSGPVLLGAAPGRAARQAAAAAARRDRGRTRARTPTGPVKALVFDATGIADSTAAGRAAALLPPDVKRVAALAAGSSCSARRRRGGPARAATAQRALEGFTRSLGKEIGRGASPCSWSTSPRAPRSEIDSTLRFLLSPRSAYVSGQVVRIGAGRRQDPGARLGAAARRQDRAGHRRLARHRRGDRRRPCTATAPSVVRLDVPGARRRPGAGRRRDSAPRRSSSTSPTRTRRRGSPTQLADGVDVVVHNAGVTRDRTIAKMPEERWTSLMEINLSSEERINDELLDRGLLRRERAHRLRLLDERASPATPARPTTPPRRPA